MEAAGPGREKLSCDAGAVRAPADALGRPSTGRALWGCFAVRHRARPLQAASPRSWDAGCPRSGGGVGQAVPSAKGNA